MLTRYLFTKLPFFFFILLLSSCQWKTNIPPGEKVDILIVGGDFVTAEKSQPVIRDGFLAVNEGKIIAIGKREDLGQKYTSEKTIDASGKIVMPGLVNTHTHAAMTMFRGLANDLPLQEWLEKHVWPAEARFVSEETVYAATLLAITEMIRSGTTTFCDMYFFEEEVALAAKKAGMRAVIGEGILDFPTPSQPTAEDALNYSATLIHKWANDPLISVALSPHSPYTCSEDLLRKCRHFADSLNVRLMIHLAETRKEVSDMKAARNMSPVEYLDQIGFLGPDVTAAHCVHLSEKDLSLLSTRKTGIAHNPQSNMKLASGVAPVPAMLKSGLSVGLGTDGVASNNDLNLWEEMNTASLLQKVFLEDPTALNAETTFLMATIGGATVLGLEDKIGSLKPGKQADLLIINMQHPHNHPRYDIFAQLVYSTDAADVETVVIEGKRVMENQRLLTLDEAEVIANFDRIAEEIRNGLNENP
ncbi:MAG: amidohydrolase [Bacteroidia bacterium]|nr:amidohydrolase [Bacteroidia bacterium]